LATEFTDGGVAGDWVAAKLFEGGAGSDGLLVEEASALVEVADFLPQPDQLAVGQPNVPVVQPVAETDAQQIATATTRDQEENDINMANPVL